MDLKLVQSNTESDRYLEMLRSSLVKINPKLSNVDIWSERFVSSIPEFLNEHVGPARPIDFSNMPESIKLETKLYWAMLLRDERNNSRSIIERRRLPMSWLNQHWRGISASFGGINFISDISHPEFEKMWTPRVGGWKKEHNKQLLEAFENFAYNEYRPKQRAEWIRDGEVIEKDYRSPRITIIGDIHKKIVINREQFEPLSRTFKQIGKSTAITIK